MKIINEYCEFPIGAAVALGAFDGIHAGHKKLINNAVEYAKANGCKSCVFTFDTLPSGAKQINSEAKRNRILEEMGVDYLYIQHFDNEFKSIEADDFMDRFLLQAKYISVGFNYRFGCGRAGDVDTLADFGKANGIQIHVEPPVMYDGDTISSTRIRSCIENAEFDKVFDMLGRSYGVSGVVQRGHEVGRKLGFPTANVLPDERMVLPNDGVYATLVLIDGVKYKAFTNCGARPTFGDGKKLLETNVFDFEGDLYGKEIEIFFLKRLRDVRTFASEKELVEQIFKDKEVSLEFFSKKGLQTESFIV